MNAQILIEQQHLKVEIPGDDYPDEIRLSQTDFSGNEAVIQVRKSQLLQIVAALGIPTSNTVTSKVPSDGGDQMHSLEVEQYDDGHIWVMQTRVSGGGGSDESIELHPLQAAWLGSKLLAMAGQAEDGRMLRRLLVLRERIAEYAADASWDDIMSRSAEGAPMLEQLNNITSLADEFLIESGAEAFITNRHTSTTLSEVSLCETEPVTTVTSVTPCHAVTGIIPPINTNAERQARYRARQKSKQGEQESEVGHE